MKKVIKKFLRLFCFFLLLLFLISFVSHPLVAISSIDYHQISGFYQEPAGSLDAVYIGSSNCYVFWNSLHAWEEYGICVYPFASSSQPIYAAEYLIRECRKTQPDAVYLINTNTLITENLDYKSLHWLLDYIPFSPNKLALTHHLCQAAEFSVSEQAEFYFNIVRYHDRWDELEEEDLERAELWRKGVSMYSPYFAESEDISAVYKTTDTMAQLSEKQLSCIESLLDYCDREQVQAVFITVPQARASLQEVSMVNAFNAIVQKRGYPTLDLLNGVDDLKLDLTQDFYNTEHTNIHGSFKFTRYLSEYLMENYGFTSKWEDPAYSSWGRSLETYRLTVDRHILPFEWDGNNRIGLPEVEKLCYCRNSSIALSWQAVAGADFYKLYRKEAGGRWNEYATVTETGFEDTEVSADLRYSYAVVPCLQTDNGCLYGNYQYGGISVAALQ